MCAGAAIGADRDQGQSAVVGIRGAIDDSVEIQSNVSVYDSATPEDDAIRGPCMVFNSVCNPRSAVSREHEYRDTLVRRGATLGANCTVVCG